MEKRTKVFFRMLLLLLLVSGISSFSAFSLQAKAAELERQEDELELTEEDVKEGRLRIPAGIYKRILIRGNIRDAAIYMKDVVVEEYMSLYGGTERSITVILSGETDIRKLIARRNVTI